MTFYAWKIVQFQLSHEKSSTTIEAHGKTSNFQNRIEPHGASILRRGALKNMLSESLSSFLLMPNELQF